MQCSKPPDYSAKYSRDSTYADTSGNGTLCHSIQYRSGDKRYMLVGPRMSIGSAIVPGSHANTLMVPDHRKRASGECSKPPDYSAKYSRDSTYADTSGNGTLCHSIQYRSGDKRYMLVGPRMSIGSAIVPGSHANTLVLADSRRQSALEHATDASLFGLERYTGQIRTLRSVTETDEAEHKLVIVVKDNGNVSLSATATVIIKAVEPKEAFTASDTKSAVQTEEENDVTFYLIITLSSVSALFLLSIIGLIVMQCSKPPDYSSKYSRDTTYADTSGNGTLCHSIQYRSGDKRYMLVGPRMSIGSAIVPGSHANTLMVPDHRKRASGECSKPPDYSPKYSRDSTYADTSGNGTLCHSIQYRSGDKRYMLVGPRMSIGSAIVPGSHANTLVLADSRRQSALEFQVVAKDSGTPSLSSDVTVNVFILDQNDNAPVILSPVSANGSAEGVEEIPRNVNAGHSVAKVRAFDADIGYNAWLSFSLQHATDASLFGLERYTGQIRTLRSFTETDEAEQKLVIVVKDNGNVSLSATATVIIKAVEPIEAFAASDTKSAEQTEEENDVTFYLIITLSSVSALFLLSIIGLIVMQCSKPPDYSPKYSRDSTYADTSGNGTLCHSIQYRSGDKRYMLVGPRMSIGSAIVPGSHANTLIVPDHRKRASGEVYDTFLLDHVTGEIRVKGQVDFEDTEVYQLDVQASDKGQPPMTVDCSVIINIGDVNDNSPEIEVTSLSNLVSEDSNPGTVIALISVTDTDSGVNGQIRTLRSFTETDEAEHKLVIVVKDNGNVSLSATATVIIKAVEPKEAFAASDTKSAVQTEEENDVTFYLIITLSSVSALFLLSIIGLIVMQCSKPPDYSPKYSRDSTYADTSGNGTLCHSIQYRSGDKRYMLVGPRMSIGSAIVPGSSANTLVLADSRRRSALECSKPPDYSPKYSRDSTYANTSGNGTLCHSIQYRSGDKRYMLVGPRMSIGSAIVPGSHANTLVLADSQRRSALECSKPPDYSAKYPRDSTYADTSGNGTLCHSIQYRSGDKRYMLVGPRMSIGSAIVPGSSANTLVLADSRRRSALERIGRVTFHRHRNHLLLSTRTLTGKPVLLVLGS
ncbi:hypothetical protein SKAU_G00322890 [Synaphobranchus kaupii]|uniref:Cadherin domain-containing protein n=1 Tax=Synaphobranchus kaupii TaxID=118154 RepID=A0A9Q1IJY8_SYNKA|nr:hypothetical protein SKAU_G00322890 [Synaphobranchus kaupii]